MDTGISMLFAGVAAWAIGYGPVEVLAGQATLLAMSFVGHRLVDWYVAKKA